jgi:hypothetical protein
LGDLSFDRVIKKMDLRVVGSEGVNWIELAQNKVQWHVFVNVVMNLWVP